MRANLPLLSSLGAGSFASAGFQVVLGWSVFEQTEDPFLVGAAYAAYWLPRFIFGFAIHVLSRPRNEIRAIQLSAVGGAASVGITAAALSRDPVLVLFVAALVVGALDTVRMTVSQIAVYRGAVATTGALALANLSMTIGRGIGAVAAGLAIGLVGVNEALYLVAIGYLLAALVLLIARTPRAAPLRTHTPQAPSVSAVRLMSESFELRSLTLMANAGEVLAFSVIALLPVLADTVLHVGAPGLGALHAARAVGMGPGLAALSIALRRIEPRNRGQWLLVVSIALAIYLILLGFTTNYALALLLSFAIGTGAGIFDTFIQGLLERAAAGHGSGISLGLLGMERRIRSPWPG